MRLVWATVAGIGDEAEGFQRLTVDLDDGSSGVAINYLRLSASCAQGDRVLLNTTAVNLALGTGGSHFVVARQGTGTGVAMDVSSSGHVLKLRYTPLQVDVLAVESQESPHHAVMENAVDLEAMPVVCCGLHSQVPLVAAAAKQADPSLRIAYCMTDHAALAMDLSDTVRACVDSGLLDATISCGQAFGGQYEAVNLHSGLLAAKHVAEADVAIVAIGPGVVGTGTAFGHGGVCQGEAINAVSVLGGTPIACLRLSFADARPRHQGVSHHTLAALSKVALASAIVPVPALPQEFLDAIARALDDAGVWSLHTRVDADSGHVAPPTLRGIEVRSMGRGITDDPAFFAAAFAAGEIASRMASTVL
ncbi:MAG: DUF3866 domain-containing protein [Actinobacteria bacterium HGW-Actinobacteria-7]|nr:MAG: DUF3866 domain-containing protein [Actinobacteria bacterium HGW-Actinobacteria-7]